MTDYFLAGCSDFLDSCCHYLETPSSKVLADVLGNSEQRQTSCFFQLPVVVLN